MDVYLFCNTGYGIPFIRSLCRFAPAGIRLNRTIVLSSRTPLSLPRRLSRRLKLLWALRQLRTGCRIVFTHDVNSSNFTQCIPAEAIGIVGGFNQIFRTQAIQRFGSLINVHPSVLPLYRGAIPSYWCIRNRETMTGFTLHRITESIDSGEVLYQEYTRIQPDDTEATLDRRIANQAAPVLMRYLLSLATGQLFSRKLLQTPYQNSINYAPAKRV